MPMPRNLPRALASARRSHHMPKPSMIAEAITPSPGAAKAVVPKKGIGIAFWIAGVLCVLAGAAFLTIGRRSFAVAQPAVVAGLPA